MCKYCIVSLLICYFDSRTSLLCIRGEVCDQMVYFGLLQFISFILFTITSLSLTSITYIYLVLLLCMSNNCHSRVICNLSIFVTSSNMCFDSFAGERFDRCQFAVHVVFSHNVCVKETLFLRKITCY